MEDKQKNMRERLQALFAYVKENTKKVTGKLIALLVLLMLAISSLLVIVRLEERPRTDDAFLLAYIANIAPDVSGTILSLNIQDNQFVRAGDILFSIDPEPYQLKLDSTKAQHTLTSLTLDRMQPLLKKGYVTAEQIDEARANKESARANEALTKRDLTKTNLIAPFDGKIVGMNFAVGEYATAGKPLFTMIDTSRWYAVANFREGEIHRMKIGAPATVYVMAHPAQVLHGHVESIGWGVTSEDATLTNGLPSIPKTLDWVRLAQRFPVRILLDNPPENLMRIGASAIAVVHCDPSPRMRWVLNKLGWNDYADTAISAQ